MALQTSNFEPEDQPVKTEHLAPNEHRRRPFKSSRDVAKSAMSSLRNAVKRKTHKERSQPGERKRLGLLEKHKDYVLRAQDYNKKQEHLKKLRLKAAFRNPDEFYFKMVKSKTKNGVHISEKNHGKTYTNEEIKSMKAQDMSYVQLKQTIDVNVSIPASLRYEIGAVFISFIESKETERIIALRECTKTEQTHCICRLCG